jgi:hypothetical protein
VPSTGSGSDSPGSERRGGRIAIAALFLVWLAFDFPILSGRVLFPVDIARARLSVDAPPPDNPLGSDAVDVYYPLRSYLGDRLSEGDVPLWDPHRFAGTPAAANTQMAVWYPPNWLFALGGTLAIYSILAVLSRLVALLLAYWFLRVLRLHPYAAAAGAVIFVFCGFQIAWGVHPTFLASSMWLPLALGGLEVAFRGKPWRGVPLAGLGLGLSVLAGHAQVALYVWIAAAIWAAVSLVARAWGRRSDRGWLALGRGAATVAGSFALGLGLSSLQLLSTAELSGNIIRGPEPYDHLVTSALPWRHLATLFLPDRFGNPVDGNYVGAHNYTETALYVGAFTLVLALLALWCRRDRLTMAFGVLGAVGLLAALGTPLYRVLYGGVPGMDQTRAIGRIVLLVDVALAGLAAIGLDGVLRHRDRRSAPVLVSAAAIILCGAAAVVVVHTPPSLDLGYLAPRVAWAAGSVLIGSAVCLGLVRSPGRSAGLGLALVALITVDLWLFGFRYFGFQRPAEIYPETAAVDALRAGTGARPRLARAEGSALPPNAALVHDLYDVHGSDTFILTRTVRLLSQAQDQVEEARTLNVIAPFSAEALDASVIDLLGVDRITTGPAVESAVDPQAGALPAAFVAPCWDVEPRGRALARIREMSSEELRSVALIEHRTGVERLLGPPPEDCHQGEAAVVRAYEPEQVQLEARAETPSILVLTDAWYPGWEATVDGEPAPVLVVDHAARGVSLSPGTHDVVFQFRPGWLAPGLGVSGATALAAAFMLLFDRTQERRRPAVNPRRNDDHRDR